MLPTDRTAIVHAALACVGTPFALNGRTPGSSLDCAGLLFCVARVCGLYEPYDPLYTRRDCYGTRLYVAARDRMDERPLDYRIAGCVFLLWTVRKAIPMHFAIWTGNGTMIHALPEHKCVVESPLGNYWTPRIFSVFDFRRSADGNHSVPAKEFS